MKVAEIVTQKIIHALETGIVPWHQPWKNGRQVNFINKKTYNGINQLILQCEADNKKYNSNKWLTFNQASSIGGSVKRGAKSTPIVFWSIMEKEQENSDKTKKIGFLRYYNVFNLDQVNGLHDTPIIGAPVEIKPEPEKVINNYLACQGMPLHEQGTRAFYSTTTDSVTVPTKESFISTESRYNTIFHELVHSTGHAKRLDRFSKEHNHNFGSQDYSKEELIAELGASILCNITGINPDYDQSASYINSWLKALQNDRNLLINASSKADKASNYILGV